MEIIARIHTDFPTKFGIPRQCGIVDTLHGAIVFEPPYRSMDAVRGLEEYSHIWLIWQLSAAKDGGKHLTVRPPKLGGNVRKGVFATRSPFRPNSLAISSLRLLDIEQHSQLGPVLHVAGVDLMDGTPIFDIKPYLPQFDSHPDATGGFTANIDYTLLTVDFPAELLAKIPAEQCETLREVLAENPLPAYHNDPERVYGMPFGSFDIRFRVIDNKKLIVCDVVPLSKNKSAK